MFENTEKHRFGKLEEKLSFTFAFTTCEFPFLKLKLKFKVS